MVQNRVAIWPFLTACKFQTFYEIQNLNVVIFKKFQGNLAFFNFSG
jgi:hypothetical protein